MTPSDLHALARVLDALLPHRTVGQRADDPQETHVLVGRLGTAGLTADVPARCARWGAAPRPTGAPPVPAEPLAPARFSGQAAATKPAAGRALSRPRSAERSEGSLDVRPVRTELTQVSQEERDNRDVI